MGHTSTLLTLTNPLQGGTRAVTVEAFVDSRVHTLCIPECLALQLALNLESSTPREVTLADGREKAVSYVGPIEACFKKRIAFVGALVMGEKVLLGKIPMLDMGLIVSSNDQEVVAESEFANPPHALVN